MVGVGRASAVPATLGASLASASGQRRVLPPKITNSTF